MRATDTGCPLELQLRVLIVRPRRKTRSAPDSTPLEHGRRLRPVDPHAGQAPASEST